MTELEAVAAAAASPSVQHSMYVCTVCRVCMRSIFVCVCVSVNVLIKERKPVCACMCISKYPHKVLVRVVCERQSCMYVQ